MATHTDNRPGVADLALDAAARLTESALAAGHRVLGRAELHVHAWRAGRDEGTVAWVADIQQRSHDGTLAEQAIDLSVLQKYADEARSSS